MTQGPFETGDRVRCLAEGMENGKMGDVVSVDEDGDPRVMYDGNIVADQKDGKYFEIVCKSTQAACPTQRARVRERRIAFSDTLSNHTSAFVRFKRLAASKLQPSSKAPLTLQMQRSKIARTGERGQ